MNLNALKVSRSVYTFWAVIGEVGGLRGVMISAAATILSVFNNYKSENHLISQLYRKSDSEASDAIEPQTKTDLNSDR